MLNYVSQLKKIDPTLIDSLYDEVKNTEIHWFDSYSDYQSGGWQIAPLYNTTGEETYDVPEESEAKPTSLIRRMPRMQAFLDSLGLDYMMARLSRSKPASCLYEHIDYKGLEKHEKLRLHMPLYTHPQALMSFTDVNVYLKKGFLWKLDPREGIHGVCNHGKEPRIHLLLDCYMNPTLRSLVGSEWLDQNTIKEVPELTQEKTQSLMTQAKKMLLDGKAEEAEHFLLTTFYTFRHPKNSSSYDLILNLYEKNSSNQDRIDYWSDRLKEVYGEDHFQKRNKKVYEQ